jgi:hypothetical protein
MEKSAKRTTLVDILATQELGDKSKTKILECFDGDLPYEDIKDPLSSFIVDAVVKADDEEEIASNLGYAISQLKRAQGAI